MVSVGRWSPVDVMLEDTDPAAGAVDPSGANRVPRS